ncbi:restriction endonuclease, partial [candidate division KSB1 bacterium]|nr:restriction endonuclease [candidate division KSB1 bacterium]
YWMLPLLGLLGYDAQVARAEQVNGKSYAISHRANNLDGFPLHIMGCNDKLGERRQDGGPRLSPHALVQEYLNITEHLYALVTNGLQLRLLRDSSRLVKLSYLEFNLEAMMEEQQFSDFALLVRLLHASRMPKQQDAGAESLIESYHQDALDSGARIRDNLSDAVKKSILALGDGFLQNPANRELLQMIDDQRLSSRDYFQLLLRLIYRLLFLMVIEERDLVFARSCVEGYRSIYRLYYSLSRLRAQSLRPAHDDQPFTNLWISLKQTFQLFEKSRFGGKIGIQPLDGELFGQDRLEVLGRCHLDNRVLLDCLRNLSAFRDSRTQQLVRVNYASLNVEEFGSVYEGLLEFEPAVIKANGHWRFDLVRGTERSASGTHYTPDELVVPLIRHSLDHLIRERLANAQSDAAAQNQSQSSRTKPVHRQAQEEALLSLRVCDIACGSGHILLNAARRIAQSLAVVRSGEEQPSPEVLRPAMRDVITHCIYGVDKNPLAVELCKVSLWLEAHNPGEPLSFLDHHIKCGDAVVGRVHLEDLNEGISDEMFQALNGDDKAVCRDLRKQNKAEREGHKNWEKWYRNVRNTVQTLTQAFADLDAMPDHTPEQIEDKRRTYETLIRGPRFLQLQTLANLQTAPYFMRKTNPKDFVTDQRFSEYLQARAIQGSRAAALADATAVQRHIFHWFLHFPEVMAGGGFDCILGNPPFLGGQKISGFLGKDYLEFLKSHYPPARSCDIVAFFFRRAFDLLKKNGFLSLLATNTIAQGGARESGLDVIIDQGGTINHAVRSMRWPGAAAVEVALVTVFKGHWSSEFVLNGKKVERITSYLDDSEALGDPYPLQHNAGKSFQGSIVLGKGFVLTPEEAQRLIEKDAKNAEVLFPYLNGEDLNSRPDQSPSRWVINFQDWPLSPEWDEQQKKPKGVPYATDYPDCLEIIEKLVKPERQKLSRKIRREQWWKFAEQAKALYRTIAPLERVLVVARISKTVAFTFVTKDIVYADALVVHSLEDYASFSILQSSFNYNWAWNYCTTMKTDLNYTPTATFEKFPFPQKINVSLQSKLDDIGYKYHEHRKQVMTISQLGLTKIYAQFHNSQLPTNSGEIDRLGDNIEDIQKRYSKETYNLWKHLQQTAGTCSFAEAVKGIVELRRLHKEMDEAVLAAYGWDQDSPDGPAIELQHDFYEVDYLPETDNVRYTISPQARKEVLKRLLLLNHRIHAEEVEGEKKKEKEAKAVNQQHKLNFE